MILILVVVVTVPGAFGNTIGAVLDAAYRLLPWG